jgi:hypothetical protein
MLEIVARGPGPGFSAKTAAAALAAGTAPAAPSTAPGTMVVTPRTALVATGTRFIAAGLRLVARARFVGLAGARRRAGPAGRLALPRFGGPFRRMAMSYLSGRLGSCRTRSFGGSRGLAAELIN